MRRCNERGAAMVESAIAATLVFMLIFTVVTCAFFARTYLATRDAASSGVRTLAIAADDPYADYQALQTIRKSASAISTKDVEAISVFEVQSDNSMPEDCKSASVAHKCNFYTGTDLLRPRTDFAPGSSYAQTLMWSPTERYTSLDSGLTKVGVYVRFRVSGPHAPFPSTITRTASLQVEPHS